jgi:hypothetical protein
MALDWTDHLRQLDRGTSGWTCLQRVEQLLAGEPVVDAIGTTARDVCDEGHVHTDVTVELLTPTRLLHVDAGDAQHVTDEHEVGLTCTVTSVELAAITDVSLSSWDSEGVLVTELRVARPGGNWLAMGDVHDCGDPECDIPPGSIRLEARSDGMVITATGPDAADLADFGGRLSLAAGA